MLRGSFLIALFLGAASVASCFGNAETVFPPGLEPLEQLRIPRPARGDGEPWPEWVRIIVGEEGDLDWGHGRAYIHEPLGDVWASLRDPEVSADRQQVSEWTVGYAGESEETDTRCTGGQYAYEFVHHNVIRRVGFTGNFDVCWRHDVVAGSLEEPEVVAGRWQKVYGTTAIGILEGSIIARVVEPDVTEIEIVEHVSAFSDSKDEIRTYLEDYYESVLAHVRGEPLP